MSRKRRNKQRNKQRKKQRPQTTERKPRQDAKSQTRLQSLASWKWHILVVAATAVAFAAFIITSFDPIDRLFMVAASCACAGIAFFIIATCTAVGAAAEAAEQNPSRPWLALGFLAILAKPVRRFGALPWIHTPFSRTMEKVLLAIIVPLGFVLAIVSPKRTWPAIAWLGAALLAVIAGVIIAGFSEKLS